jgi:hypothetical protein
MEGEDRQGFIRIMVCVGVIKIKVPKIKKIWKGINRTIKIK